MAKYTPLPKTLEGVTRRVIQDLIAATEESFKGDLFGEVNSPLNESYTSPNVRLHWSTNKELLNYVLDITHTSDIRSANKVLYSFRDKAPENETFVPKEAPEQVDANIASKAVRDTQELERQKREELEQENKASKEKIKKDIEDSVKKQREIYDQKIARVKESEVELKDKKIYYRIKKDLDTTTDVNSLRQQAEANPKKFVLDSADVLRKSNFLSNLPQEEIDLASKSVALSAYKSLTGMSPIEEATLIRRLVVLGKINEDVALDVISQKLSQHELAKEFFDFGKIDGKFEIEISDIPIEGFKEYNLSQIPAEFLDQQNLSLEFTKGFGVEEMKSQLLLNAGSWINTQISRLPVESTVSVVYRTEFVQTYLLPTIGLASSNVIATEGSVLGNVLVGSGNGQLALFVQGATGVSLGVGIAASAAETAATTTAIVSTGGIMAAEAFAGGAGGAAAGAAAGSVVPVVGTIIGAVGGLVAGTAISKVIAWVKDNIHKAKGAIITVAGGLLGGGIGIATGFGALSGGILGGFAGWGAASLASGGLPGLRASANIGAKNVMNIGWAIGTTALAGIGGPILTILLVFPLIITLILFIINSGAYVVPPGVSSASSQNQYIDVTKTATPAGPFKNSDLPLKIKYNITITAKKSALTNVKITDTCTVVTKEGQQPCQSPPIVAPNGTIAVGAPLTFSYEAIYNSTYTDALVLNTVKVTANVIEETALQTAEGSYSIIIGNPPTECFEFDKSWANQVTGKANVSKAILKMSAAKTYMATLCKGGKITLTYSTKNVKYGGEIINGGITLYRPGTYLSDLVTLYTLAHESGHIYAHRTSADEKFADDPKVKGEGYICTYPMGKTTNEDFAETIALYISKVAGSTQAGCMSNFRTQYPNHWSFARNSIFFESLGW